jgi:hypothetical protein
MGAIYATNSSERFRLPGIAFRPHGRPRIAGGLPDFLGPDTARDQESRFELVNIEFSVMKACSRSHG